MLVAAKCCPRGGVVTYATAAVSACRLTGSNKWMANSVRCRSKLTNTGGSIGDFRYNLWKFKYKLQNSNSNINSNSKKDRSPFYITTPIYYVNGDPHIGHAYTSVACDVISRFHRMDGREVHFLTGTDEHGQKVEKSALKAGKIPSDFADEMSAKFRELTVKLNCSNDDFIRTSEQRHIKSTEAIWKMLESNGDIYLGHYEGWYSLRDEAFYSESELINGKAPTGADVEWVREESYFFRLSRYTDKLLQYYNENRSFILPFNKRNEIIGFLKQEGGLTDLSISRTTFSWGIKVPNNSKHVIYVWLDALINYLSALGFPHDINRSNNRNRNNDNSDGSDSNRSVSSGDKSLYDTFWPASVHVVGKDILRFHAVYWPAFLMSLGLRLPTTVFAHGWWTKDGEKMSKSLGNVIDPLPLIDQYGVDYLRYFLSTDIVFGSDGDFNKKSFINKLNADLVNEIGNLVQRVLVFTLKNCDGRVPYPSANYLTEDDLELMGKGQIVLEGMRESMNSFDIKSAIEQVLIIPRACNKYLTVYQPWFLVDSNVKKMNTVLYLMIESIRQISILLTPVIPASAAKIQNQLNVPDNMRTFESLSLRIAPGSSLGEINHIFPRIIVKKDDYLVDSVVNNLSALNEVNSELNNKKNSSSNSNKVGSSNISTNSGAETKAKKAKTKTDTLLIEEYMTYPIERILILIEEIGHEIRIQKSERQSKGAESKHLDESADDSKIANKEKINPNVEASNLNRNINRLLALKECYKIKKEQSAQAE